MTLKSLLHRKPRKAKSLNPRVNRAREIIARTKRLPKVGAALEHRRLSANMARAVLGRKTRHAAKMFGTRAA